MYKNFYFFFLLSLILFSSCFNGSDFEGYNKTESGLHYKLIEIGDSLKKPRPGDYLQLTIAYKTENDSIFLDGYSSNPTGKIIIPFNHSSYEGSFEDGLKSMCEGDSMSFIVKADELFDKFFQMPVPIFLEKKGHVKVDVKLYKILNEEAYQKELLLYEQIIEDRDIEEQRILKVYVDTVAEKYTAIDSGMYYLEIVKGRGDKINKGDTIALHYKGCFLHGKVFESTYERKEPLKFVYGDEGQVIKGIEKTIKLMNQGSKAKIILPSQFAFGESGSINGTVPPYTSVIYEIEVVSVKNKINI